MKIKGIISSFTAAVTIMTAPVFGAFAAEAYSVGDVNGDSTIDASDASDILYAYTLKATTGTLGMTAVEEAASDVNGDGATDAVDASKILSYYAYTSTGGDMLFPDFILNPPVNHSGLYNENYTVEEIIYFFNEIVLNTEYPANETDSVLLTKWKTPIYYAIQGDHYSSDEAILENLFSQLNQIEGFPGIYEAESIYTSNLDIYFCTYDEFYDSFGEMINYEPSDGAVTYWYNDNYEITYEKIGYMNYLEEPIRTSVMLEEIINGLGTSDTLIRTDSIVYQYGSEVTSLSDVDMIILRLLYNPLMKCGMNAEQCEKVIRQLYY